MMRSFPGISLKAVTAALPAASLGVGEFGAMFGEREVRRIMDSTGITSVRVANSLTVADLCEAAARQLISKSNISIESIDAIVVVTQTPDDLMPGVAVKLHARLGLPQESLAFDINYGCSGFIYGLTQAAMLITSGGCKSVLLCTGDITTQILNPDDHHVRLVFGDAASASLVTSGDDQLDVLIRTDGSGRDHLRTPLEYGQGSRRLGYLRMNGSEVMNFALTQVPPLIKALLEQTGITHKDIDLLVFHQANRFIINYLRKMTNVPSDRVPIDVADVGNTGPSSIPLLLARAGLSKPRPWANAIVCGFGVGLSWGAAKLDLSNTDLIPPVEIAEPNSVISASDRVAVEY
jgi:3-oxoacyl-[acyl-carrier-protein] synthase-3